VCPPVNATGAVNFAVRWPTLGVSWQPKCPRWLWCLPEQEVLLHMLSFTGPGGCATRGPVKHSNNFPLTNKRWSTWCTCTKNTPSYNKYFDVRPRGPNNSLNSSVRGYAQCQRHSSDPALSKRREGPLCGLTVVDLRLPTGDRDLKDPPPGTQKKGASNCGVCRKPCSFLPLFDCRLSSARAGPDSNALVFD